MSSFKIASNDSQPGSLGASFSAPQRATRWRRLTPEETYYRQVSLGSLNWEDDVPTISSDADTHVGSSDDDVDGPQRPGDDIDGTKESDAGGDLHLDPQRVPFWPSRGSRKVRAQVVRDTRNSAIHQLPVSAHLALPGVGRMSKNDVRFCINKLFGFEGKLIQVDTIWPVAYEQESMILIAKRGLA